MKQYGGGVFWVELAQDRGMLNSWATISSSIRTLLHVVQQLVTWLQAHVFVTTKILSLFEGATSRNPFRTQNRVSDVFYETYYSWYTRVAKFKIRIVVDLSSVARQNIWWLVCWVFKYVETERASRARDQYCALHIRMWIRYKMTVRSRERRATSCW
jgi:hypothetical protein